MENEEKELKDKANSSGNYKYELGKELTPGNPHINLDDPREAAAWAMGREKRNHEFSVFNNFFRKK